MSCFHLYPVFLFRDRCDAALHFPRHQGERLIHVDGMFCRRLDEAHVVVVGQLFAIIVLDLALLFQILLVADENAADVFATVLLDFAHPCPNLLEGV